jgi:hypothetical protein
MRSAVADDGRDALDFPLEISADEHRTVTITMADRTSEVAGVIADAIGTPSLHHTVIVFAADDRYWTPRSRRIVSVRPDTTGRYRVRGLPAGEYVVALGPPDLFGVPPTSLMRELRQRSTRVTLREGDLTRHDVLAR